MLPIIDGLIVVSDKNMNKMILKARFSYNVYIVQSYVLGVILNSLTHLSIVSYKKSTRYELLCP